VEGMSSTWASLPALGLVGASFLVLMEIIGRQKRGQSVVAEEAAPHALRWSVITLLVVASLAHIPVTPEHLEEAPYMGVMFIGFSLSSFSVATVLALRPGIGWYRTVMALCAAAIGAYVATRLIAFPQLADDVGAWTEPLGLVSMSAEAGALVLSAVALRTHHVQARVWRDRFIARATNTHEKAT
jgi:hypothetical protein